MSIYSTISAALRAAYPKRGSGAIQLPLDELMARQWQHAVDCQAIANALSDRDEAFASHKFLAECNPNSEAYFVSTETQGYYK